MTQFHEGQEVEVGVLVPPGAHHAFFMEWRKAKIVGRDTVNYCACDVCNSGWLVQFPDNTRDVFDAEHIRADLTKLTEADYDPQDINQAIRNQLVNQK